MTQPALKHVDPSEMSHLMINEDVRMWQVLDGIAKRLTDSVLLNIIEGMSVEWKERVFWQEMNDHTGLANGFYIVEHSRQKVHFFPCDTYTPVFDKFLFSLGLATELY